MKKRRDLRIGKESKVSEDAGLEGLKAIIVGKTVGGREFQSLDVIEINELANVFVRLVSNLSAYRGVES